LSFSGEGRREVVAEEGASSRRRWFGSMERGNKFSLSLSLSLSLTTLMVQWNGTKGVRWRETLLPRLGRRYQMNRYGNMGGGNIDLG